MKLTIHRGSHEIGGNCIELQSANCRVLLDIGQPLVFNGESIKDEQLIGNGQELVERGVLPDIKGLYAWDIPAFSGVVVSHGHLDHYGFSHFVHPEIPLWSSKGTRKIIELSQLFLGKKSHGGVSCIFDMYQPFTIGPFEIFPYLMDHSAFDAAAYELRCEGKTVQYTGDFRNHGRKAVCYDWFLEKASQQADILIIEGSTLGRAEYTTYSEAELEKQVISLVKQCNSAVAFQCSSQNIDRLVTFYRAAIQCGRELVIDVYTANVLAELRLLGNRLPHAGKGYPNIRVYFPSRLTTRIVNTIGESYAKRFALSRITRQEMNQSIDRLMIMVRPSVQYVLERMPDFQNGVFIYSLWEGYRQEPPQKHFEAFLQERGFESSVIHTSGHADATTLRRTIDILQPKWVLPIHSFHRDEFSKMSDLNVWMSDGEVLDF